ncbi:MAG TPA: transporter substrate-binding domain-containing protein, partial [Thermodesulfobacteriota bacterium]|nr:transporter substrate-binding domain-containing protein [Thermodesulfobacteriota bacterium]
MKHKEPMCQVKGLGICVTGVAAVLIVGVLFVWRMRDQAMAQSAAFEAGKRPILFLANESLPPMNFMKNGKPTGIVVDLAKALAKHMRRPVKIRLMDWTEAQQLVLEGRADALLQINPSPERLKMYDFSEPLLTSEFSIFTPVGRLGISSMIDLRRLRVGVERRGLPMSLLQDDPKIVTQIIPDFVQGFRMLAAGALDAVVADRWVGSYAVAENKVRGVKVIEEPISRSNSSIAVKKGNLNLLGEINAALADIRRDGTYDRIIGAWRSKEVVFETREQLGRRARLIGVISVTLILALISVAALVREVRRRKSVEATLRESEERFRTLANA